MSSPQVKYTQAGDGVSIAYVAEGAGPTAVVALTTMPFSPLLSFDVNPAHGAFYEAQCRLARTVLYDCRGMGHSERDVHDLAIERLVSDLEAVVAAAAGGRPVWLVFGTTQSPTAIAFAALHPELVEKLVLWLPFAFGGDIDRGEWNGFIELAQRDWEMACQSLAFALTGWSDSDAAKKSAEVMRRSIAPEQYVAFVRAMQKWDVRHLLPQIQSPTLVMHRNEFRYMPLDGARKIAGSIANARFRAFEGKSAAMDNAVGSELLTFLLADAGPGALAAMATPSTLVSREANLRTVLFTDLAGHTAMMSRLGDERGRAVLREHETITRKLLKERGGTEVKTMGDGFMASFGSVTKAVECAIALQRAFADREGEPLSVRVGLNAGEPIEEDGDLFGATVILASRIVAKAEGSEILVADTVRGLCSGKGFLFADRGEFVAKGFEEPVRVYEVRWRDG